MGGRYVTLVLFLVIFPASLTRAQINELLTYLYYENQTSGFNFDRQSSQYHRNRIGIHINLRAQLFSPRFLALRFRGILETENWSGNTMIGELHADRKTPYNLQIRFLPHHTLNLNLSARRSITTTESAFFYSRWTEESWSIGHQFNFRHLPRTSISLQRTRFLIESFSFRDEFRRNEVLATLQHRIFKSDLSMNLIYQDYNDPRYPDALIIKTRMKHSAPTQNRSWQSDVYYYRWGSIRNITASFNFERQKTRLYSTIDASLFPDSRYYRGEAVYRRNLRDNLVLELQPGFTRYEWNDSRYNELYLQPSSTYSARVGHWQIDIRPRLRISYHNYDSFQEIGYGSGILNTVNTRFANGQLRLELGIDYDYRPILPYYSLLKKNMGFYWSRSFSFGSFDLFSYHIFQNARSGATRTKYNVHQSGIRVTFPQLRTRLLFQTEDLILDFSAHRRRYLEVAISPLRWGPFEGQIFERLEYVDGSYFSITRTQWLWRWGRIRLLMVGTLYRTLHAPTDRNWWDLRFQIQRPINLI